MCLVLSAQSVQQRDRPRGCQVAGGRSACQRLADAGACFLSAPPNSPTRALPIALHTLIVSARCASCSQLDLERNNIGSEGAKTLADALKVNASLTDLNVCANNITGDGAQQLAATVLGKQSLECFCKIPLKELRADSLTELNLRGKGVEVPGALVLAELLQTVSASLTSLNVGSNEIGDEGAQAIGSALMESKVSKLKELVIYDNSVGPDGAKSIAAFCAVSASLTQVLAFCQHPLTHPPLRAPPGFPYADCVCPMCLVLSAQSLRQQDRPRGCQDAGRRAEGQRLADELGLGS